MPLICSMFSRFFPPYLFASLEVSLSDLERMSGLTFFPAVERHERLKNLCEEDSCQLMDFKRFTLYISGRKVASARTLTRLEKIMTELKDTGITPDQYLSDLYLEKKRELAEKEEREKKPEPWELSFMALQYFIWFVHFLLLLLHKRSLKAHLWDQPHNLVFEILLEIFGYSVLFSHLITNKVLCFSFAVVVLLSYISSSSRALTVWDYTDFQT